METKINNMHRAVSELCKSTDADALGVNKMLIDITVANIEAILKFKRHVIPKIQKLSTAFNTMKTDLDSAKKELVEKEEKIKSVKKCWKCPTLENELSLLKKKQAENESRIKSIAKILTRHTAATQGQEHSDDEDSEGDSDQSTVTKIYNLVSQMLVVDMHSDVNKEIPSEKRKIGGKKKSRKNLFQSKDVARKLNNPESSTSVRTYEEDPSTDDDILIITLPEINEGNYEMFHSPLKEKEESRPTGSPVIGKNKKVPLMGTAALSPDLVEKEEKIKSVKKSWKCPTLEEELSLLKKTQAENESRIKSMAKILTRHTPATQGQEHSDDEDSEGDSDQSTVTKTYNLVSQMLVVDIHSDVNKEIPSEKRKIGGKKESRKNLFQSKDVARKLNNPESSTSVRTYEEDPSTDDDILIITLPEINEGNYEMFHSPLKEKEESRPTGSPVIGKNKKVPLMGTAALSPDLVEKEEKIKSVKKSWKCPTLEEELSLLKKTQAENESRIKSMAKILTRHTPATQGQEHSDDEDSEGDSDQSTVTKTYNLVSQMLVVDIHSDVNKEIPSEKRKIGGKKESRKNLFQSKDVARKLNNPESSTSVRTYEEDPSTDDDILIITLPEINEGNYEMFHSPLKEKEESRPTGSPVIGKNKKVPLMGTAALSPDLVEKEEKIKSVKKSWKCPTLEEELSLLKKTQAENESRIKSMAKILTRHTPATQGQEHSDDEDSEGDSDQSTVTKTYNLVSQMLVVDIHSDVNKEIPSEKRKIGGKKESRKNLFQSKDVARKLNNPESSTSVRTYEEDPSTDDDILIITLPEINEGNYEMFHSPLKEKEESRPTGSPVIGKNKKVPLMGTAALSPECSLRGAKLKDRDYDNSFFIPSSPVNSGSLSKSTIHASIPEADNKSNTHSNSKRQKDNFSEDKLKKVDDFWQLKTTPFIDSPSTSRKKGVAKLMQAKLSLGCLPQKLDLRDLEEFNGGIHRSQTSTQIVDKEMTNDLKSNLERENSFPKDVKSDEDFVMDSFPKDVKSDEDFVMDSFPKDVKSDEDFVMDSPDTNISGSRRKGSRLLNSKRKLFWDANVVNAQKDERKGNSLTDLSGMQNKEQGCNIQSKENEPRQERKGHDDSCDSVPKPATSPKYKYRGETVRKIIERQKLAGWDCENCKKYYEAAGGENASEDELRKLMDRCSRHRDKYPVRSYTPPGFWDAEFPPTPACDALNKTLMDILPARKKKRMS